MKKLCKGFQNHSLFRNIMVLVTSMVIGAVFNIPFGWAAMLDFVTAMVIFIIITEVVADAWFKLAKEKYKLCWQYFVGATGVLVADWFFLWASRAVEIPVMSFRLGCCAVVAMLTGLWFHFVFSPVVVKKDAEATEAFKNALINAGVKPEFVEELANGEIKAEEADR